jgi:ketosteroid isomerase-like protein
MEKGKTMRRFLLFIGIMGLAACSGPSSSDVSEHAEGLEAKAVVETVYVAVAEGDMERFAGLMAPDIVWNEAEGNPYADKNPYVGPDAVMSGLFGRLASEWDDFSATPHELVVEGDRVIVFGRYKEVYKATGKALDIPFVPFMDREGRQAHRVSAVHRHCGAGGRYDAVARRKC